MVGQEQRKGDDREVKDHSPVRVGRLFFSQLVVKNRSSDCGQVGNDTTSNPAQMVLGEGPPG